jgi:putative colanic acid biosynthesis acetyltransferase WcaF
MSPDLSAFDNSWYHPGRRRLIVASWFFLGLPLLGSKINPLSSLRRGLLRMFGANIARNVVIKPGVQVKYPWHLSVGCNSWIGENVWIDNLGPVTIGSNVCLSQGAYLCTGNHNWSDAAFGLIVKPISVGDGAWVGAKSVIGPGVDIAECAIAAAGSVVTKSIPAYEIHAGNPATFARQRVFQNSERRIAVARSEAEPLVRAASASGSGTA